MAKNNSFKIATATLATAATAAATSLITKVVKKKEKDTHSFKGGKQGTLPVEKPAFKGGTQGAIPVEPFCDLILIDEDFDYSDQHNSPVVSSWLDIYVDTGRCVDTERVDRLKAVVNSDAYSRETRISALFKIAEIYGNDHSRIYLRGEMTMFTEGVNLRQDFTVSHVSRDTVDRMVNKFDSFYRTGCPVRLKSASFSSDVRRLVESMTTSDENVAFTTANSSVVMCRWNEEPIQLAVIAHFSEKEKTLNCGDFRELMSRKPKTPIDTINLIEEIELRFDPAFDTREIRLQFGDKDYILRQKDVPEIKMLVEALTEANDRIAKGADQDTVLDQFDKLIQAFA